MWVESHQSLRNHPKIKKAARLASVNEFEMIGRLHCLWWWALDYAPDGDLTNYSAADIESAVDWLGTEGAFYSALIGCGFNGHCGLIERTGEHVTIHDWHEYGGKLMERREMNKDRMRQRRALHVQNTTDARTPTTEDNSTEDNSTEHADNSPRHNTKETCPAEWMTVLYQITQTDPAVATVAQRSNLSACGKALIKGGATLAQFEAFSRNWYALDWRGKKGQPPTSKQIRDEWGKYSHAQNGNGSAPHEVEFEAEYTIGYAPNGKRIQIPIGKKP